MVEFRGHEGGGVDIGRDVRETLVQVVAEHELRLGVEFPLLETHGGRVADVGAVDGGPVRVCADGGVLDDFVVDFVEGGCVDGREGCAVGDATACDVAGRFEGSVPYAGEV